MITIFNRRTVYLGFDMKAYADMKDRLDAMGIKYKTSVKNRGFIFDTHRIQAMGIKYKTSVKNRGSALGRGKGRGTSLDVGRDFDQMYQYEIWVHADDYERVK